MGFSFRYRVAAAASCVDELARPTLSDRSASLAVARRSTSSTASGQLRVGPIEAMERVVQLAAQELGLGRCLGERQPSGQGTRNSDRQPVDVGGRADRALGGAVRARRRRASRPTSDRSSTCGCRSSRRRCRSRRGRSCRRRRRTYWPASRRDGPPRAVSGGERPPTWVTIFTTAASGIGPSRIRSSSVPPRNKRITSTPSLARASSRRAARCGVLEAGHELRLSFEPADELGPVGELRADDLDRDVAIDRGLSGPIDDGKPLHRCVRAG